MPQIILLTGTPEDKAKYISKIVKSIPNSVYLNINNLYSTFGKPLAEKKIEGQFVDRVKKPSHEVILEFAKSNLKLDKVAIIDGDYDPDLLTENLPKIFDKDSTPTIRTIHFRKGPLSDLEKNLKNHLFIDVTQDEVSNNQNIKEFLSDITFAEEMCSKNGLLVMSAGLGGSGKTTLLEPVAQQVSNFCYFDSDIPTIPFLIGHALVSDHYGQYVKNPRYECVLTFAIDNILHYGKNAIIDGCFGDKLTSPIMQAAFTTPGVIPTVVYCHCTGETQKTRIIERGAERDKEKLKDLPADRRNNIEKHLVEFAQVDNPIYVDTENKSQLSKNTQRFISDITSPDFKPLTIRPRVIPFDKKLCAISKDEAQGRLDKFKTLLNGIKLQDYLSQKESVAKSSELRSLSLLKHKTPKPLQKSLSMPILRQKKT